MIDPGFGTAFDTLIKFGLVSFLFLYIIFSGIVIKQVSVMTQTVEMGFEGFVKAIAIFHFVAAVAVFIFSLTSL